MLYLSILLLFFLSYTLLGRHSIGRFSKDATLPLRGFLALFIVLHHLSLRLAYIKPDGYLLDFAEFIDWGEPIVSVFFFMSGYGIIKSYQNKGKSYLDGFITGRLLKIVVPYIICCILYIPFNNFSFSSIICLETWKHDCPFLPSSWFVIVIFIEYLFFYFVARIFSEVKNTIISNYFLSLVLVFALICLDFRSWWWKDLICFNFGMSISFHEEYLRRLLLNKKMLLVLGGLLLFVLNLPELINISSNFLLPIRVFLLPIFVWQLVCYTKYTWNSILKWLGNISYEIYLVHTAILIYLYNTLGINSFLLIILTYTFTIISALLLNICVKKLG
jgi:peptidoglycan/LPS O-acetylase OafA/YrhL